MIDNMKKVTVYWSEITHYSATVEAEEDMSDSEIFSSIELDDVVTEDAEIETDSIEIVEEST